MTLDATVWGATSEEVARDYPADDLLPGGLRLTRAISVAAPPDLVWRWLCQIAVAPYSYDWIDNLGRQSPQQLTPGADRLVLGQTMAMVFELTSYDDGHQWTALTTPRGRRLFGPVAITYAAEPDGTGSRIVCRIAAEADGALAGLRARALAWGDLVMMRRQLMNLKGLAERDAAQPLAIADQSRSRSAISSARWRGSLPSRTARSAGSARR